MSLGIRIDWLTLSKNKWEADGSEAVDNRASALAWAYLAIEEVGLLDPMLSSVPAARFYTWAWVDDLTGVRVDVPQDVGVQGVKVTFSGATLDRDGFALAVLRTAVDHGYACTRVDVAIDLMEEGIQVDDIMADFETADLPKNMRTGWVKSPQGNTFTIGSRLSERYLRIYDKGKQQKIPHQWTRIECEYKGGLARLVAGELCKSPVGALPDMLYSLRFVRSELRAKLEKLGDMRPERIKSVARVQSSREIWFYGQVASAFRSWADEDYNTAKQWATTMLMILDKGI
jgi:hypothetical protein